MGNRPQPQDKYIIRLPVGLRDRIKADAEANRRSMNAEILARIFQPVDGPAPLHQPCMDLRDWFAGKALTFLGGIVQRDEASSDGSEKVLAEAAYKLADAMLAERSK